MTKTKEILSELRLSWRGGVGSCQTRWELVGKEGGFQIRRESILGPYLVLPCNLGGCDHQDQDQTRKEGNGVVFLLEFPAGLSWVESSHGTHLGAPEETGWGPQQRAALLMPGVGEGSLCFFKKAVLS